MLSTVIDRRIVYRGALGDLVTGHAVRRWVSDGVEVLGLDVGGPALVWIPADRVVDPREVVGLPADHDERMGAALEALAGCCPDMPAELPGGLPVLRKCGDCVHMRGRDHRCEHPRGNRQRLDPKDAPPPECPLRGEP